MTAGVHELNKYAMLIDQSSVYVYKVDSFTYNQYYVEIIIKAKAFVLYCIDLLADICLMLNYKIYIMQTFENLHVVHAWKQSVRARCAYFHNDELQTTCVLLSLCVILLLFYWNLKKSRCTWAKQDFLLFSIGCSPLLRAATESLHARSTFYCTCSTTNRGMGGVARERNDIGAYERARGYIRPTESSRVIKYVRRCVLEPRCAVCVCRRSGRTMPGLEMMTRQMDRKRFHVHYALILYIPCAL